MSNITTNRIANGFFIFACLVFLGINLNAWNVLGSMVSLIGAIAFIVMYKFNFGPFIIESDHNGSA